MSILRACANLYDNVATLLLGLKGLPKDASARVPWPRRGRLRRLVLLR